ncbi:MAG: Fur family transcriptional regulator [Pseudomonadota bacterium]
MVQSQVMAILNRRSAPVSAYQILDEMRDANPKIAPMTVYRALAALTKNGMAHRLESLNAYMPCQCQGHADASILSICDDCGHVEERVAPDLLAKLSDVIGRSGFAPLRHVIEVHGVCADCGANRAQA